MSPDFFTCSFAGMTKYYRSVIVFIFGVPVVICEIPPISSHALSRNEYVRTTTSRIEPRRPVIPSTPRAAAGSRAEQATAGPRPDPEKIRALCRGHDALSPCLNPMMLDGGRLRCAAPVTIPRRRSCSAPGRAAAGGLCRARAAARRREVVIEPRRLAGGAATLAKRGNGDDTDASALRKGQHVASAHGGGGLRLRDSVAAHAPRESVRRDRGLPAEERSVRVVVRRHDRRTGIRSAASHEVMRPDQAALG